MSSTGSTLLRSLSSKLSLRQSHGLLRSTNKGDSNGVDFSSNDYLGLSRSRDFVDSCLKRYNDTTSNNENALLGSTGSRLLSGTSQHFTQLESTIASSHGAPTSLIFNSGYVANLGIFGSVCPGNRDFIVVDELVHSR